MFQAEDLVRAIEEARAEERRFIASLSPVERAAKGTHERWSAKDLVAHVAAAKRRLVRAIDGELETLDHDEPTVYAAHARDPWPVVEDEAARAASDLAERVGRQVAAQWLDGRPLESFIAGYAIRHPLGHVADYHEERGKPVEASRVRAVAERILATLPPNVARP